MRISGIIIALSIIAAVVINGCILDEPQVDILDIRENSEEGIQISKLEV